MPKAALLLLGIAAALFAEEQIEMFAQSVTHEGNITRAQGDVAIRSEGRFMRADNLIFCRDTGEGEMFGNVYYSRSNEDLIVSDYIWFKNGISRQLLVDHLFSAFAKSGLWLSGNEAEIDGNVSIIRQGALSGCDPSDPDWSIRFSSATYDRTDEWIDLYNSVFYAGGVPLIYLPYFGYYTDGKRHSGFLFPRWGNSNTDGTMFELPLYFAPFDFADLEIWKQWRGIRGEGEAMTLRFVDSAHSKGRINIGRFIDNISYAAAKGVQERVKYGGDILYERTRVFTDANSPDQEGLTLDYRDFNDIEYIQLRSIDPIRKENYIDYLVTNKADFFYKNDDIYANTNVRYFKDYKTRSNNDRIVQILPEAQLHLFNRSLFSKHVLFNADIRYRNLSRKIGSVAQDISVTTPIEWYFSAFDDFLKLSAQYQIDYYQIIYNNRGDKQLSNGTRSSSTLTLKAGTSVAKDYGNFFHTIDSGLTFIDTPAQNTRGDFTEDFYTPVVEIEQEVSTDYYLVHFLYDKQGKELLRHRLTQPIDLTRGKLRPLTNEIGITLFDQSISNETSYSHKLGIVTSTATTVSGDTGIFDYSLRHLYKYSTDDGVTDRYIQGNVNFNINANHSLKFSYERDLLEESTRGYEIAHTYRKSCWETQLSFTREIAPYNVSGGTSASRDSDIIFLRLTLVPFGNISQQLYASERTRR